MAANALIRAALTALVGGRVYPSVAPEKVPVPYITYQAVGGGAINFLEGGAAPAKNNARVQINVWHDSAINANALSKTVENSLRATAALQTTVLGAPVETHDPGRGLYGTRQDFSFWFDV